MSPRNSSSEVLEILQKCSEKRQLDSWTAGHLFTCISQEEEIVWKSFSH